MSVTEKEPHVAENIATRAAQEYMKPRRKWWNKWTKLGLGVAGLAGVAALALLPLIPVVIPASAFSIIYSSLASTAIAGGGIGVMGAVLGGKNK